MKKLFTAAVMTVAISSGAFAQVPITNVITNAFDFGGDVAYSSGWTNGTDGGFGFGAWTVSANNGGGFIGNPTSGGIGGMSAQSFGLFANPTNGGNFVNFGRGLDAPLAIGQTFSFQWGNNWDTGDAGFPGNKGVNLLAGGTQIFNLNMGANSATITVNGTPFLTAFGTNSVYFGFTRLDATTYTIFTTSSRDNASGGGVTTNLSSSSAIDNFQLYASQLPAGDNRQPYFNDFSVTAVPEPSTYALLALSAAGLGAHLIRRRRR